VTYWNHRIVRKNNGKRDPETGKLLDPDDISNISYGIHEVYYDDNDKAHACTTDPITLITENVGELIVEWYMYLAAFTKPILDYDSIPEEGSRSIFEERMNDMEKGETTYTEFDFKEITGKDFDLKEYYNECAVERIKSEKEYNETYVGKSKSEILENIIEKGDFDE
jgi:hypothetical protein